MSRRFLAGAVVALAAAWAASAAAKSPGGLQILDLNGAPGIGCATSGAVDGGVVEGGVDLTAAPNCGEALATPGGWTEPTGVTVLSGRFPEVGALTATVAPGLPFTPLDLDRTDLDTADFTRPRPGRFAVSVGAILLRGDIPAPAPEAVEWGLMIGGFLICSVMLRRARKLAAFEA
jgi:hypothetical protein